MKTRTIILTGQDKEKTYTAVLTLNGEDDLFCDLTAYNLPAENLYTVVLKVGNSYYMGNNINLSINYHFIFNNANINQDISVVVFDAQQEVVYLKNNITPDAVQDLVQYNKNQNLDKTSVQTASTEELKQEVTTQEDNGDENFFNSIKVQLDEMFKNNPNCIEVENLIKNSKWVSVQEENEDNTHYILGKIFDENNNIKYVCYGVPAVNKEEVNNIDTNLCQWLPLNPDDENSAGYYIMYQNATTGETVKFSA